MGQTVSSMLKPFVVMFVLVSTASAQATEPVVMVMGLSGEGKTTTINNLCGTSRRASSSMSSTTTVEEMTEIVDCGYMQVYDMVGLGDIPPGESIENAVHRGLEKTLSFIDGKNIGHIYFVTSTSYNRDHSRLIEQVQFIKGIMNPMTKWTVVINCFNGACPSDNKATPLTEFLEVLSEIIPNFVEVRSPHMLPVDKALFPAPVTGYMTNLPPDWRERIAAYDTNSLRVRSSAEAIANCKEHQDAYVAASEAIKNHSCRIDACVPTDCPSLDDCPSSDCPAPDCATHDTCQRKTTTTKNSWVPGSKKTTVTEQTDTDCLRAITACNDARSEACVAHTEKTMECNEKFSTECLKHQKSHQECTSVRAEKCETERKTTVEALNAVMDQHQPFVEDCQKYFTIHSFKP